MDTVEGLTIRKESQLGHPYEHNREGEFDYQHYNMSCDLVIGMSDVHGERFSRSNSVSSSEPVELPSDVPDGPQFADLAMYIDSVVAQTRGMLPVGEQPTATDTLNSVPYLPGKDSRRGLVSTHESLSHASNHLKDATTIDEGSRFLYTDSHTSTRHYGQPNLFVDGEMQSTIAPFEQHDAFANFENYDSVNNFIGNWAYEEPLPSLNKQTSNDKITVPDDLTTEKKEENMDDFGDFTGVATTTINGLESSPLPTDDSEENIKQQQWSLLERLLSRLESSLEQSFGTAMIENKVGGSNGPYIPDVNLTQTLDTDNERLFRRLCHPDRVLEMRQYWLKSSIYMAYLDSLHMNNRTSMPPFASQLGLLKPTPLVAETISNKTPSAIETPLSGEHPFVESECYSNTALSKFDLSVVETNSMELLDLDLFELHEISKPMVAIKTTKIHDLELELPDQTTKPTSVTIKLNALRNPFPCNVNNPDVKRSRLSEAVRATLSRLPKLSYMRSSRLMFPVLNESAGPNNNVSE